MTIVIDIVFYLMTAQRHLELDMTRSPTILTRRSVFHVGAGLAVAAMATPLVTPASAHAEDARQAGAEPLNGDGFYRFKIGDFQAAVISDGYGQISGWADLRYERLRSRSRSGVEGQLHAAGDPNHEQHVGGRHGTGAHPCR
jgi:hypothetical protein